MYFILHKQLMYKIVLVKCTLNILYSFLNSFSWTRSPFLYLFSAAPLPLRGQPTVKYYARRQLMFGLAVHYRLERLPDTNPGLQVSSLVSLPLSHCPSQLTTSTTYLLLILFAINIFIIAYFDLYYILLQCATSRKYMLSVLKLSLS
jgi:hypothetical protein